MIVGVLLAAGQGQRFGAIKQLATLPDGRALVHAAATNLRPAVDTLLVVVRADETGDAIAATLSACDVEIVRFAEAERGMGASLAVGVKAAIACGMQTSGWLVALGDMPWIQVATALAVADTLKRQGGIVVPTWRGQRGHPVGFAHAFTGALTSLDGDSGARGVLKVFTTSVHSLVVDDPGVVRDVDVAGDLTEHA